MESKKYSEYCLGDLPRVGKANRRKLEDAGFVSIADVAGATIADLHQAIGTMSAAVEARAAARGFLTVSIGDEVREIETGEVFEVVDIHNRAHFTFYTVEGSEGIEWLHSEENFKNSFVKVEE